MIIHNIYTSGSRKYPAHYAHKRSLEITTGSRVLQAKILFLNLALEISQWGRSGWGSLCRNLSTVNFIHVQCTYILVQYLQSLKV